jgi:hypothetical protein
MTVRSLSKSYRIFNRSEIGCSPLDIDRRLRCVGPTHRRVAGVEAQRSPQPSAGLAFERFHQSWRLLCRVIAGVWCVEGVYCIRLGASLRCDPRHPCGRLHCGEHSRGMARDP